VNTSAYDDALEVAAQINEARGHALAKLEADIGWAQAKNWAESHFKAAKDIRARKLTKP
jgi:hypothetical protein